MVNKKDPKLLISQDEFAKIVKERILLGQDMTMDTVINNFKDLEEARHKFDIWDERNRAILKTKFDISDNEYLDDYENWGVITMGYGEPDFREQISDLKADIESRIKKLEVLINKIDLIPVSENLPVKEDKNSVELLLDILNGFHRCAQELRHRYSDRDTITIKDEYDVQDLLGSILKIFFKDVRPEDYSPSSAGGNSRIDFVLPEEDIIIEVKNATEKTKDKELGEQIAIDIARYEKHPSYKTLVVFIYDKGDNIRNKRGLIQDLEIQSKNGKKIIVIINPE